ncbi:helix-turn-helix domain-containing protein [Streptomyces daliensis]
MPAPKKLDRSASVEAFLGGKVREARTLLRFKQDELATKVFSSGSVISAIELGEDVPSRDLARKLGLVLGLGDDIVDLVKLIESSQVRGYAKEFLRKQLQATVMHEWAAHVPGLLQTEGYARALLLAGEESTEVDAYVQARMERQEKVWGKATPPLLWAVVDAAVLYRGPREVRRGQLQYLLDMSDRPQVTVRVLPFDAEPGVVGYLSVLDLPDGGRYGYVEGHSTGRGTGEPGDVQDLARAYDRAAANALSALDSMDAIKEALNDL